MVFLTHSVEALNCPVHLQLYIVTEYDKKLSYRRRTTRRAMSVEILSTAAQLYEKSYLKR